MRRDSFLPFVFLTQRQLSFLHLSVDSTGLLERLRTRRMTKVEVAEDDPQRREAWFSAAETLRKAATVGVSGAQVDAFGKPIGFSKEVHNALRAKKIYNRAPKNKTQYDTLTVGGLCKCIQNMAVAANLAGKGEYDALPPER